MKTVLALTLLAAGGIGSLATTRRTDLLAQQYESEYANVVKVQVRDDSYLWINVRGNFKPEHGCTHQSFARSQYRLTDPRTDALERVATASLLSGHPVYVWTQGCVASPYGPGTYPMLTGLQVFIRGGS